ncbi:hypothetical protein JHK85_002029 [Glycine max]|nr:hypothetical protein JHK85_002029 [Glycine max]KAG5089362.1 hypothetical protein JHK86_001974 [Glycine max]
MEEPVVDEEYLKEMTMARRELGAFITNNKRAPLMLQLSYLVCCDETDDSLMLKQMEHLLSSVIVTQYQVVRANNFESTIKHEGG